MMTEGGLYLFGIALVIAYFLILKREFGENHFILKYLFIMAVLLAGYFVPTAMYDIRTQCDVVMANATVTGNTTAYEYTSFCYTTDTSTPDTFYQVFAWVYYFMIAYFIIKLFRELYLYMKPKVMRWNQ